MESVKFEKNNNIKFDQSDSDDSDDVLYKNPGVEGQAFMMENHGSKFMENDESYNKSLLGEEDT